MTDHCSGCDTLVALKAATVNGQTLWGKNSDRPENECQTLVRIPGGPHACDEVVRTQYLSLPQVRQTFTAIGSRPQGLWGFEHGVNEHQLVIGNEALHHKLKLDRPGLLGMDLVRLGLERCRNARQAIDLLTSLIQEHGQGSFAGCLPQADYDNAFLIADSREAVVLEAAGRYWAIQEVREVRALSNMTSIRQDWDRLSPGLADQILQRGWWPEDGSKLDFAGAVAESPLGHASAVRRWGWATLLLEQQSGSIDHHFLRRILTDHYEDTPWKTDLGTTGVTPVPLPASICMHGPNRTAASMIAELSTDPNRLPIVWCAAGSPCLSAYLPLFLDGDLPEAVTRTDDTGLWQQIHAWQSRLTKDSRHLKAHERLAELQARLDQDAEAFAVEGAALRNAGDASQLARQAALFMEQAVEQFQNCLSTLTPARRLVTA